MRISTRPIRPQEKGMLSQLPKDDIEYSVVWYGPLFQRGHNHQPTCKVYFSRIEDDRLTYDLKFLVLPLTSLKDVEYGDIYKNSIKIKKITLSREQFSFNFEKSKIESSILSTVDTIQVQGTLIKRFLESRDNQLLIPKNDETKILNLNLPNGISVYINPVEYLVRGYTTDCEILRVISTYDKTEIFQRLNLGQSRLLPENEISIIGPRWISNEHLKYNAPFLGYLATNNRTRYSVASINGQIRRELRYQQDYDTRKGAYIVSYPWHEEIEKMLLEGIWLDKKTFFGFTIRGRGLERNRQVQYQTYPKQKRSSVNNTSELTSETGVSNLNLTEPEEIDLGEQGDPQHASNSDSIKSSIFEVLSEPNTIRVLETSNLYSTPATPHPNPNDQQATNASAGAPYGTTSNIMPLTYTPNLMIPIPSKGFLMDFWLASRKAASLRKDIFLNLCWINSSGVLISSNEPKLISLTPLSAQEITERKKEVQKAKDKGIALPALNKSWLYFDKANRIPRGVLAIHMRISYEDKTTDLLLIEVQKRTSKPNSAPETHQGAVIIPKSIRDIPSIISAYLDQIRKISGVPGHLNISDALLINGYSHNKAKGEKFPRENALLHAISRGGVKLPRDILHRMKMPPTS